MFIKQINESLETAVLLGEIDIDNVQTTLKKLSGSGKNADLLQVFPCSILISEMQAAVAAEQAISAFQNNTSSAKTPELEFLRRVTAQRQIEDAIKKAPLVEGENEVCLVAVAPKTELKKIIESAAQKTGFKEKKIDLSKNKNNVIGLFQISKEELETLSDLENPLEAAVIEKIAFVNIVQ